MQLFGGGEGWPWQSDELGRPTGAGAPGWRSGPAAARWTRGGEGALGSRAAAVAPPGSGWGGAGPWWALRGDWSDPVIEGLGPAACSLCSRLPIPGDHLPNLSLCFRALSSLIPVTKRASQCHNQTRSCARFKLCSLFLQNEAGFRPRSRKREGVRSGSPASSLPRSTPTPILTNWVSNHLGSHLQAEVLGALALTPLGV